MPDMTAYPKRLIEVDLPIARISAHARHEKSIRHGHISTLHIWWARRPLAACRAVVCASLWPDPVDLAEWALRGESVTVGSVTVRAQRFLTAAREQMLRRVGAGLSRASADSLPRLFAAQKDPSRLDDPRELRALLLDFIADFADWTNSNDPEYLAAARCLTEAAHGSLGGEPGTRPIVADPFAGGGSIPLEALRIGSDAFASDLNPVAVLLNKVLLEYVPKYGGRLIAEFQRQAEWIQTQLETELGAYYPGSPSSGVATAYLWARTVVSDEPSTGCPPVEVPLVRSMWLRKSAAAPVALRWSRDTHGNVVTQTVEKTYADGTARLILQPVCELFEPKSRSDVEKGTSRAGSATCPVTGYSLPVESVRAQLAARRGGADDARLLCVAWREPDSGGHDYCAPSRDDIAAVQAAGRRLAQLQQEWPADDQLVPDGQLNHLRGFFNVVLYGMTRWGDVFSSRQLLALTTLVKLIRESARRIPDAELVAPVQACLALGLGRCADKGASLVVWDNTRDNATHVFGRQALPMVWDFSEVNPLSANGWSGAVGWIGKVLNTTAEGVDHPGTVAMASATEHSLPDDSVAATITDPPYYAAIPYADLSDFFYSWLAKVLRDSHGRLFADALTPKADECVSLSHRAAMYRNKDNEWFESMMTQACSESRRVTKPEGVGVFVFANKETAGWEAMLSALVDAGWTVTGSWPIDTEMGNRLRAQNSAVLASSVHLVCRPRENPDGTLRHEHGEWRAVLSELPTRIHEWMPRIVAEGVVGADAVFACLGPALEIFSRYSRVERASGEPVSLREYLEQVWAAVSKEALSMIFDDPETADLEPDSRLTAMWLWTIGVGLDAESGPEEPGEVADTDQDETSASAGKSGGYFLEFDAARKIAQGLGIYLEKAPSVVEVKKGKARLLSVAERTAYLFGNEAAVGESADQSQNGSQLGLFGQLQELERASDPSPEVFAPAAGDTALDRVHQAMILFAAGRGDALRQFLVEDGVGRSATFWKLAQALSALYPPRSDERRWVEGLLARKKSLGL